MSQQITKSLGTQIAAINLPPTIVGATTIAQGGTGATTATGALANLGAQAVQTQQTVSVTTTLTGESLLVLCTNASAIVLTLPAASAVMNITVKQLGAGSVTITPASGTIDGASTKVLNTQYTFATVVSDGTNQYTV